MDIKTEGIAATAVQGNEDKIRDLAQRYLGNPRAVRVEPTEGEGVFRLTTGFDSILTDETFADRLDCA